jgi:O-antigen/teichoic acid export membrane protein
MLLGWLLGVTLSNIILLFPSWKLFNFSLVSKSEMKSIGATYKDFPMINSLHAFTDILATQFLLFALITGNYGALQVGLFAVMNRYLRAPLALISSTVSQLYYREASTLKNQHLSIKNLFNKSQGMIAVVLIPVSLVIVFFGPQLFTWYLGSQWTASGNYARIMLPAVLMNFLCSTVSSTPILFEKQKTAYLFSVVGYVFSLSSIVIGAYLKLDFSAMLWIYSIVLTLYYLSLFIWYRYLISKFEHHVHLV